MGSNKMLRAGRYSGYNEGSTDTCHVAAPLRVTRRRRSPHQLPLVVCVSAFHAAAAIICLALLAGCSNAPLVTSVDLFCTRVDRFHATDGEREALKANSGPLERLIRWVAGINQQWDETCLKPVPG